MEQGRRRSHWVILRITALDWSPYKKAFSFLNWTFPISSLFSPAPQSYSPSRIPLRSTWPSYLLRCSSQKAKNFDTSLSSPLSPTMYNPLANSFSSSCKACPRSIPAHLCTAPKQSGPSHHHLSSGWRADSKQLPSASTRPHFFCKGLDSKLILGAVGYPVSVTTTGFWACTQKQG